MYSIGIFTELQVKLFELQVESIVQEDSQCRGVPSAIDGTRWSEFDTITHYGTRCMQR